VLVSPDGELYRVPFSALLDASGRHVIEYQRIAYVSSGRDVVAGQRRVSTPASLDLALLADPDFTANRVEPALNLHFQPLPGTAAEARLVPPLVTGNLGQQVLTGRDATRQALLALSGPRLLHIATHGIQLKRDMIGIDASVFESSLARSGLVLSADEQVGNSGVVTALEISAMDLRGTELVVLSVCDSGAGSVTKGQGLIGLRRAFAVAGAKNLLLSLWPVDDAATVGVMEHFYRRLSQLSPADALREAQIAVIRDFRSRGQTDLALRVWAPFLIQGMTPFTPTGW
jgi:CHAT domain-containing protein